MLVTLIVTGPQSLRYGDSFIYADYGKDLPSLLRPPGYWIMVHVFATFSNLPSDTRKSGFSLSKLECTIYIYESLLSSNKPQTKSSSLPSILEKVKLTSQNYQLLHL